MTRPPDSFYGESDEIRVAWLESAARAHPAIDPGEDSPGRHTCRGPDGGGEGNPVRRGGEGRLLVFAETGNFFLDHCYEDGNYDGFCDPWEDEIIAEGTEEWRKANALMDSVCRLADWLEEELPGRFAEMLDTVLPRLPEQEQGKEDDDHDD